MTRTSIITLLTKIITDNYIICSPITDIYNSAHLKSLLEAAAVGDEVGNGAAAKENGEDEDGGD